MTGHKKVQNFTKKPVVCFVPFCGYSFYRPATTSGLRSVNSSFVSEGIFSFSPLVRT